MKKRIQVKYTQLQNEHDKRERSLHLLSSDPDSFLNLYIKNDQDYLLADICMSPALAKELMETLQRLYPKEEDIVIDYSKKFN